VLKALRPDRLPVAIKEFVRDQMGIKFLTPPVFDLEESYADSSASTPLIFILPGNDPNSDLNSFAEIKKKEKTLIRISLG
jgi:dynein heavy chain